MILLDAVYINQSGGKVLLEYFIEKLILTQQISNFFILFDKRLQTDYFCQIPEKRQLKIEPKESERLKFYKNRAKEFSGCFCFANVPPPIRLKKQTVYILFHNAHIIKHSLNWINFIGQLKYYLKYLYIKKKNYKSYIWIVQTSFMKDLLVKDMTNKNQKVLILPFFSLDKFLIHERSPNNVVKYLYVADGQVQKNHDYLFKVWEALLQEYNIKPKLFLTIANSVEQVSQALNNALEKGLNIENLGYCDYKKLKAVYAESDYLLYPSLIESFGLPLLEGASAGCRVIGVDKPYIHEVIQPSAVFNDCDINSLKAIILKINAGQTLKKTKIIAKDNIENIIKLLIK